MVAQSRSTPRQAACWYSSFLARSPNLIALVSKCTNAGLKAARELGRPMPVTTPDKLRKARDLSATDEAARAAFRQTVDEKGMRAFLDQAVVIPFRG
jgi:hypothetical protein